jgi:putative tryptophan/tyrosine transport system substrate-binding protein
MKVANIMVFALGSLCVALCSIATAQPQGKKVARIGYLAGVSAAADTPRLDAFRQGLRDLGYLEGQNIVVEYRHENQNLDRLPQLAKELIALKLDVLVTVTTNAAQAAQHATRTIPIVFMGLTDPITAGVVDSLARPGRNATGVTNMAAILTGKRLELLKETLAKVTRVAVLWDRKAPGSVPQWNESQQPARDLGLQLYSMEVSSADGYELAFKEAVKARNQAVWVTLNPLANSNQKRIADLAINHRLPSMCAREDYADNGCLMAYGPGYADEGRKGARYVDRILKGARPADIPVEQPMKFDLIINLKTANQIGHAIPPQVLARADKVIK